MNRLDKLSGYFDSGDIIKPAPDFPNSLDLYRALARLAGAQGIERGDNSRQIEEMVGQADHYLFIMLDGLGMSFLENMPETSFLKQYFVKELRALTPPTTAVSLTSLATLEWGCKHSVPGWYIYLEEIDKSTIILPFIERFSERPLGELGLKADIVFPLKSVWSRIKHEPATIIPEAIANSEYTQYSSGRTLRIGYKNLADAYAITERWVQGAVYPTFTYLYISQLDSQCHDNGVTDQSVMDLMNEIDLRTSKLCESIKHKAKIVITADHGLIDTPESKKLIINRGDKILDYLLCPPTVESRMPTFHVKTGMEKAFIDVFNSRYGDDFVLINLEEAEQLQLYGPCRISPLLKRRLGTFIGISIGKAALHYRTGKDKHPIVKAVHGGLSREEMMVPLIII